MKRLPPLMFIAFRVGRRVKEGPVTFFQSGNPPGWRLRAGRIRVFRRCRGWIRRRVRRRLVRDDTEARVLPMF